MEKNLQENEVIGTVWFNNKPKVEDIVLTKTVAAGKRIYYLDVKQNTKGEYYVVLTESKKVKVEEGTDNESVKFEKHKIFLYKEDFDKFSEALNGILEFTKEANLSI